MYLDRFRSWAARVQFVSRRERAAYPAWSWVILVAGATLSAATYPALRAKVRADAQTRFERASLDIGQAIALRLATYTDLLIGLRGLFQASEEVSAEAFERYVSTLEVPTRYPAVIALNFAAHVPGPERAAFEARQRRSGRSAFAIETRGEQPHYQVLVYSAPPDPRARFGLDIRTTRPERVAEFDSMRDTGEILSSVALVPVLAEPSLAVRAPAYRGGAALDSPEARRRAFLGSVGITFSLQKLFADNALRNGGKAVHLRIYGLTQPSTQQPPVDALLFDSSRPKGGSQAGAPAEAVLTNVSHIPFGGKVLAIHSDSPAAEFLSTEERAAPHAVAAFGVLISLLLFGLVRSMARRSADLERAVLARTGELERANRELGLEMDRRLRAERELVQAGEQERRKVGHELHEDIAQRLTAAALIAASISRELKSERPDSAQRASRVEEIVSSAVLQIDALARGLDPDRPTITDLPEALRRLAGETQEIYGVQCRYDGPGAWRTDTPVQGVSLYRIALEAIRNAATRGGASRVVIELQVTGACPKMRILDDGRGYDERRALEGNGLGLRIMRHRANLLGLEFSIQRNPEGGTVVQIG